MVTKVLAVVASHEPSGPTYASLLQQTVVPSRIIVADKIFPGERAGVRVRKAINFALEGVDLQSFDWFLRVDGDVVLPADWIQRSVATGADVIGRGGYALLIRMGAFLAIGGRWPAVLKEDSFMVLKLASMGYRISPYVVSPVFLRAPGRGTDRLRINSFISDGYWNWKLGYEPVHAVYNSVSGAIRRKNPKFLLAIVGYFFAASIRMEKVDDDLARFVFRTQVRSLSRGLSRTRPVPDYSHVTRQHSS
jgi:hypothetical protein